MTADKVSVTAYKRQIFGFGIQRDGVIVGWAEERVVRTGDLSQCRVIIFDLPEDPAEAARWREMIMARPDVCLVNKEKADAAR